MLWTLKVLWPGHGAFVVHLIKSEIDNQMTTWLRDPERRIKRQKWRFTFFMRMLRLSEAFLTNGDFLESVELSLSLRFIWKTKKNSRESNISSHTSLNIHQIFYCLMFHSVCECESPCRCTGSEVQGRTSWSGWWCSLSWRGSAGGRPGGAPSVGPPSRGGTATGCPCSSPCWPAQRERGDEKLFKNLL